MPVAFPSGPNGSHLYRRRLREMAFAATSASILTLRIALLIGSPRSIHRMHAREMT